MPLKNKNKKPNMWGTDPRYYYTWSWPGTSEIKPIRTCSFLYPRARCSPACPCPRPYKLVTEDPHAGHQPRGSGAGSGCVRTCSRRVRNTLMRPGSAPGASPTPLWGPVDETRKLVYVNYGGQGRRAERPCQHPIQ